MSASPTDPRDALLKKISDKLTWVIVLLVLTVMNTCSLADDLSDAAHDLRRSEGEATTPAAPAATPAV